MSPPSEIQPCGESFTIRCTIQRVVAAAHEDEVVVPLTAAAMFERGAATDSHPTLRGEPTITCRYTPLSPPRTKIEMFVPSTTAIGSDVSVPVDHVPTHRNPVEDPLPVEAVVAAAHEDERAVGVRHDRGVRRARAAERQGGTGYVTVDPAQLDRGRRREEGNVEPGRNDDLLVRRAPVPERRGGGHDLVVVGGAVRQRAGSLYEVWFPATVARSASPPAVVPRRTL